MAPSGDPRKVTLRVSPWRDSRGSLGIELGVHYLDGGGGTRGAYRELGDPTKAVLPLVYTD